MHKLRKKQSTEKAQKEIISKSKEYISEEQKEDLEELLIKTKSDIKAFMQFCKVSNLANIEVCNYDAIYQRVKAKLKE